VSLRNTLVFALCLLPEASGAGSVPFLSVPRYPTGNNPVSVVVADFNGDGNADLAVGNAADNTVSVLLGKGDGTFQPKVDYPTARAPGVLAVGDFNGDGKPDLVVTASIDNKVSVLLNKGDGTLLPHIDFSAGTNPAAVAVGDFNGDGKLDLVVVSLPNAANILLGNGDGTFTAKLLPCRREMGRQGSP